MAMIGSPTASIIWRPYRKIAAAGPEAPIYIRTRTPGRDSQPR